MKQDIKRRLVARLKRIEGQIRGLERMVNKEKYCVDIITQTQAVKQSLSSVEDLMLENHLSTHVIEQIKRKDHNKAIKEMVSIYKLSKKK